MTKTTQSITFSLWDKVNEKEQKELSEMFYDSFTGSINGKRDTSLIREPLTVQLSTPSMHLFCSAYAKFDNKLGISTIAKNEKNEIVGCMLNEDLLAGMPEELIKDSEKEPEGWKIFLNFLEELNEPFHKKHKNVKKGEVFHLWCIATKPGKENRNKGIGSGCLKHSLETAKKKGFKIAIVETTGTHSQYIFKKFGFKLINELFYDKWEFPKNSGKFPYKGKTEVNKSCTLMILDL